MTTFADIQAAVAEITTVRASVVMVIENLIARIRATVDAPTQTELSALLDELAANRGALADAVASGTTAAGEKSAIAGPALPGII